MEILLKKLKKMKGLLKKKIKKSLMISKSLLADKFILKASNNFS